jgi:hypothetical protein
VDALNSSQRWAAAILHNGLGHYQEALTAGQRVSEDA